MSPTRTLDKDLIIDESMRNSKKLIERVRVLLTYIKVVTGRGLTFDRLREYSVSDEARMIDWNSLSRTNKLYSKVYKEERNLDVVFMVDISESMTLGTTKLTKNEYTAILTTTLASTAIEAGDKVGLVTYSDSIKEMIEPEYKDSVPFKLADKLSEPEQYGGKTMWENVSDKILQKFDQDTFIFIISDFIGESPALYDFMATANEQFRGVFTIMVRDPRDSYLPEDIGKIRVIDPDTGNVDMVDVDEIREEYNRRAMEQELKIKKRAESTGGDFFKAYTDKNFVDQLAKYLKRREQWK